MLILGIETSCDETAAAIVRDGKELLSSAVASSMTEHIKYGGVVPEVAARSHIELIIPAIQEAFDQANTTWEDIDAIAVTYGAGLGGSLLIGVMTARTLAITYDKPLLAINHVHAHVYANFITSSRIEDYVLAPKQPDFPALAIIVSGGHSQLVLFKDHDDYQLLGRTQDDAIGEAFDKVAKILGLPYPGGPSIAKKAALGEPNRYKLPVAQMPGYDFSFSGPKTAVLRLAQAEIGESYDFPSYKLSERLSDKQKCDIAASFQYSAIKTIVDKAAKAAHEFRPVSVLIAGGVAASEELRSQLTEQIEADLYFPDPKLCTDNAAMVATLAYCQANNKRTLADPYKLTIEPALTM